MTREQKTKELKKILEDRRTEFYETGIKETIELISPIVFPQGSTVNNRLNAYQLIHGFNWYDYKFINEVVDRLLALNEKQYGLDIMDELLGDLFADF